MASFAIGERSKRMALAERRRKMSPDQLVEVSLNLNDRVAELEGRIRELRNLERPEDCLKRQGSEIFSGRIYDQAKPIQLFVIF